MGSLRVSKNGNPLLAGSSTSRSMLGLANGSADGNGMNIRGLAGPCVVIGNNFAPGTTAADIQSAMEPVGGEMQSCRIMATSPTVIAEMSFTDKQGAEKVVATFNNQKVCLELERLHSYMADLPRPTVGYCTST
jgi:hypothetical protein